MQQTKTEKLTLADILGRDQVGTIFDKVQQWERDRKYEQKKEKLALHGQPHQIKR